MPAQPKCSHPYYQPLIRPAAAGRSITQTRATVTLRAAYLTAATPLNDGYSDLANTRALNDMAKTMAANMPRQILVVEDVQASLQNKAMLQSMSNF